MARRDTPSSATGGPTPSKLVFDYHRTIIGYHGTTRRTAGALIDGAAFGRSANRDDWLGHGVYFWEYAPQQAWWWADRRYGKENGAVVGAVIRLGRCLDLLDPANVELLDTAHGQLERVLTTAHLPLPSNFNTHKYLDCAVFNSLYDWMGENGYDVDSCRATFVPMQGGRMPRAWDRSGILRGAHIQVCVRELANILAVWSVRRDGRYGKDK